MIRKLGLFFALIKFEHSIFALPFAYLGVLLAERGLPSLQVFVLVTLAMISARTFGMTMNRLADFEIDRRNPRTRERAVIIQQLTLAFLWSAVLLSALVFLGSVFFLPKLCLYLSPIPLFAMAVYPYLKRFTWLSHIALGLILAMAPVGGWLAAAGKFEPLAFVMAASIVTWVAGFDILYALQDYHYDRQERLHSAPARWGKANAIFASRLLHALTVLFFFAIVVKAETGFFSWAGFCLACVLILREHMILEEEGLLKLERAFFTANAWISFVFFTGIFLDLLAQ